MTANEQFTWEQRLQYPTRTVTFDNHPDVKEYIMSYDEIKELNKVEKNLLLDQAIEEVVKTMDFIPFDSSIMPGEHEHRLIKNKIVSKLKELKE